MITCIREVRRAKGMTLQDVADACVPPTTAQTIGRLETGTRTVSVGWLNRIAGALGVIAADLVTLPERADLPVAAVLAADGARPPRHAQVVAPPMPGAGDVALIVDATIGDYRAGDTLWCERIAAADISAALNRDMLVPAPAGRFLFGRLLAHDGDGCSLLPPGPQAKPQRVADPAWAAVVRLLVRVV